MSSWKELKGFDVCNKCHSQNVSLLCDDTGYIPNGTEVKCNECDNTGETMAYGPEEVVTEWGFNE